MASGLGAESITYDLYTGQPSVTDPAYWQRPEVCEKIAGGDGRGGVKSAVGEGYEALQK